MATLLYPRRSGTGSPVKGKLVPDNLVAHFEKQGFSRTPDITNEKAAEHFFEKKLSEAQNQLSEKNNQLSAKEKELAERERLLNEKLAALETGGNSKSKKQV